MREGEAGSTTAEDEETPASYDALPAELVVSVVLHICTGRGLVAMGRTCQAWRNAITAEHEQLWRAVTLREFPRAAAILRVKPSAKPWDEIYRLQCGLRPQCKAEDFVISFELSKWHPDGNIVLAEGAATLLPGEDDDSGPLSTAAMWAPGAAPTLLSATWGSDPDDPQWTDERIELWNEPRPKLSIWVTRDMQTMQLYEGDLGLGPSSDFSPASYDEFEGQDLPEIRVPGRWPDGQVPGLQPDLDERTGQLFLHVTLDSETDVPDYARNRLVLDYLEMLLLVGESRVVFPKGA
jgi:hypothetical protein